MRPVVLDPPLLLSGLLAPDGMRRRLLVLMAYGALTYHERFAGPDEIERMRQEAEAGAEVGGPDPTELLEEATAAKRAMSELLPAVTPDDLCLVASPALLDELERAVLEEPFIRHCFPEKTLPAVAIRLRLLVASLTAIMVPEFESPPPGYTGRKSCNAVVHTAIESGLAYTILADDRRIARSDPEPTIYSHRGFVVPAYRFSPFVEEEVNTLHFNLGEVDGRLLDSLPGRA
jgi:hypothetical protein